MLMKKIMTILGVIVALASCQKSILYTAGLQSAGVVTFQTSGSSEIGAFMEADGPVSFTIASSVKTSKDVEVSFEPVQDQAVLDAYNKKLGTKYEMLPEDNYDFESLTAVIPAGSGVSEAVTSNVSLDGLELGNGVKYCLPLKITGTNSTMVTIPGEEYAYMVIRGYVYASAAHLPGGAWFEMPTTVKDPRLALDVATLEIRVKIDNFNSGNPGISTVIGTEENFLMRFGDISCKPNQLQLSGQGVSITSKMEFSTNKWYHVAIVGDGLKQKCKMYINGELIGEETMGGKGINLGNVYNTKFCIGMSVDSNRCMHGYVSEARLWGRELSAIELVNGQCSIANPVQEAADNALLGYWKLDSANKGKDLSENGFDGVEHGGISYTAANIRCPE